MSPPSFLGYKHAGNLASRTESAISKTVKRNAIQQISTLLKFDFMFKSVMHQYETRYTPVVVHRASRSQSVLLI